LQRHPRPKHNTNSVLVILALRTSKEIGDIVWSINPDNDNLHQWLIHMKKFCA
jgi:hypothetical protein